MVFEPLARLWGYPVLQVRFEELPLGGGGAHIGDLNISIFLQGLHDGPQLGTPPSVADRARVRPSYGVQGAHQGDSRQLHD